MQGCHKFRFCPNIRIFEHESCLIWICKWYTNKAYIIAILRPIYLPGFSSQILGFLAKIFWQHWICYLGIYSGYCVSWLISVWDMQFNPNSRTNGCTLLEPSLADRWWFAGEKSIDHTVVGVHMIRQMTNHGAKCLYCVLLLISHWDMQLWGLQALGITQWWKSCGAI